MAGNTIRPRRKHSLRLTKEKRIRVFAGEQQGQKNKMINGLNIHNNRYLSLSVNMGFCFYILNFMISLGHHFLQILYFIF